MLLGEGLRMFKRRLRINSNNKKFLHRYSGNHLEICSKIIGDCWNSTDNFFMTSAGHFCEFWVRDFAFNIKSLIALGYEEKCEETLQYALSHFINQGHITTTINPQGKPFNFPNYTPESLALILYSLDCLKSKNLLKKYMSFLESEAEYVFNRSIDKKTGLITKKEIYYSCRDHIKRYSSCYDNTMMGLLSRLLTKNKIENPFSEFDYEHILIDNFWKKNHFIDDLSGSNDITGDANSIPYVFLLDKPKFNIMLKKSIEKIQELKLDIPLVIKYSSKKESKANIADIFAKDYESDSCWPHVGYNYISAVMRVNKKLALKYLNAYKEKIEEHHTFPEVYFYDGTIFKSPFYYCDEAMLWSANHLAYYQELKVD